MNKEDKILEIMHSLLIKLGWWLKGGENQTSSKTTYYSLNWWLPFTIGGIVIWYPPLLIALLCFFCAGYLTYRFWLPKDYLKNLLNGIPSIARRLFNRRVNSVPHTKPIQEKKKTNHQKSNNKKQPPKFHSGNNPITYIHFKSICRYAGFICFWLKIIRHMVYPLNKIIRRIKKWQETYMRNSADFYIVLILCWLSLRYSFGLCNGVKPTQELTASQLPLPKYSMDRVYLFNLSEGILCLG